MNLVLSLTPELESRLSAGASQLGIPLPDYALQVLSQGLTVPTFKSGAEVVAWWEQQGVIGSRPDIVDVEAHSRALRAQSQTRARP